jgi:hypothetical protein
MNLKEKQKEFWEEVNRILWEDWDPIGIGKHEWIRDEYISYVPSIYKLLMQNEPATIIAHRLNEHVRVSMGMQPDPEHNLTIAKKLMACKVQFFS